MNTLTDYLIPYKGLKIGHYRYDFKVDDRLFGAFEGAEIQHGKANVHVEMDREANRLNLDVTIEGEVEVTCDRCLEKFDMPIQYEGALEVRFAENAPESDGEVMWIAPSESEVDVAQYIYESICLSLPYQRVHPTDAEGHSACDPDMLARFSIVSEEELERRVSEESLPATHTPWSGLDALKKNLEQTDAEDNTPSPGK